MQDNDRRHTPPPKGLKPVLCMMEDDRPELEADDNTDVGDVERDEALCTRHRAKTALHVVLYVDPRKISGR
ncbi:hypothetical protein EYF80_060090 [Liparis tanakae]|uniref:Uncharacterized protein n=1 Tax=Liparis tanakae TaxID=230148 RepID=A0A4Z2EMG9_9TELE|nr:hypothetical protein EYF80_060090 [Liparis tanakae]